MHVTITKAQDGVTFITKDSFGELFSADVEVDAAPVAVSEDATLELQTRERYGESFVVGVFSWVDYKDTLRADASPTGVRHTGEFFVSGSGMFGPYSVVAIED